VKHALAAPLAVEQYPFGKIFRTLDQAFDARVANFLGQRVE
jgi:hypothetical protein